MPSDAECGVTLLSVQGGLCFHRANVFLSDLFIILLRPLCNTLD